MSRNPHPTECSKCGVVKPRTEYYWDRWNGWKAECKACTAVAHTKRKRVKVPNWHGTRTCTCCGEAKPVTEYRVDRRTVDGRKRRCNDCQVKYSGETEEFRERNRRAGRRYYQEKRADPEFLARHRARTILRKAVAAGEIIKPIQCQECGHGFPLRQIHGHHHDYSKPLDVEWLCRGCHEKTHAAVRYPALNRLKGGGETDG